MRKWWNNCEFRQDHILVSNLNLERHTIMANMIKVRFLFFLLHIYLSASGCYLLCTVVNTLNNGCVFLQNVSSDYNEMSVNICTREKITFPSKYHKTKWRCVAWLRQCQFKKSETFLLVTVFFLSSFKERAPWSWGISFWQQTTSVWTTAPWRTPFKSCSSVKTWLSSRSARTRTTQVPLSLCNYKPHSDAN